MLVVIVSVQFHRSLGLAQGIIAQSSESRLRGSNLRALRLSASYYLPIHLVIINRATYTNRDNYTHIHQAGISQQDFVEARRDRHIDRAERKENTAFGSLQIVCIYL